MNHIPRRFSFLAACALLLGVWCAEQCHAREYYVTAIKTDSGNKEISHTLAGSKAAQTIIDQAIQADCAVYSLNTPISIEEGQTAEFHLSASKNYYGAKPNTLYIGDDSNFLTLDLTITAQNGALSIKQQHDDLIPSVFASSQSKMNHLRFLQVSSTEATVPEGQTLIFETGAGWRIFLAPTPGVLTLRLEAFIFEVALNKTCPTIADWVKMLGGSLSTTEEHLVEGMGVNELSGIFNTFSSCHHFTQVLQAPIRHIRAGEELKESAFRGFIPQEYQGLKEVPIGVSGGEITATFRPCVEADGSLTLSLGIESTSLREPTRIIQEHDILARLYPDIRIWKHTFSFPEFNGKTYLIAPDSLTRRRFRIQHDRVPFFSDIPLIGNFFTDTSEFESEIALLILLKVTQ